MLDRFDLTPIFVVTHGDCIMYDPLIDNIQYTRNAGVVYEVGMEKDQFILKGAFNVALSHVAGDPKPLIKNTVVVDLLSIVNQMTIDLKSKKIDQNEFLLMGYTERPSYCMAHINTTAVILLIRMIIYAKGQITPIFAFNKIETEATINDGVFRFPLMRLHSSGTPVNEMEIHEIESANILQEAKAIFIRSAIRHPELRRETAQRIQDDDWLSITKRDEKVSSLLRKLFPIK